MNRKILTIVSVLVFGALATAGGVYAAAGNNEVEVQKTYSHSTITLNQSIDITTRDLSNGYKLVDLGTFCTLTNVANLKGTKYFLATIDDTNHNGFFAAKGKVGTDTEGRTIPFTIAINGNADGATASTINTLTDNVATEIPAEGGTDAGSDCANPETIKLHFAGLSPDTTRAGLYDLSLTIATSESIQYGNGNS